MRVLSALALVVALTACGDKSSEPIVASLEGTWALHSINGTPLPFVVAQSGADKMELTGDVFTVAAGGRFTQVTTMRTTINGQTTTQVTPDAGNYTLTGNAVVFQFDSDGMTGTAALTATALTVTGNGIVAVYTKQ
jgi:hypothetical protein